MNTREKILIVMVVIFAMVLAGRVIYQGGPSLPTFERATDSSSWSSPVDEGVLEKKINDGKLSDHEALYYEVF